MNMTIINTAPRATIFGDQEWMERLDLEEMHIVDQLDLVFNDRIPFSEEFVTGDIDRYDDWEAFLRQLKSRAANTSYLDVKINYTHQREGADNDTMTVYKDEESKSDGQYIRFKLIEVPSNI